MWCSHEIQKCLLLYYCTCIDAVSSVTLEFHMVTLPHLTWLACIVAWRVLPTPAWLQMRWQKTSRPLSKQRWPNYVWWVRLPREFDKFAKKNINGLSSPDSFLDLHFYLQKGPVMKLIHLKSQTSVALPIYTADLSVLEGLGEAEKTQTPKKKVRTS